MHYQYANVGVRQEEALKKAEAYAEQALRLDPESTQAHVVLGLVAGTLRGDQREAARHFKQALSVNPNDWDAIFWLLNVYYVSGKSSAAWPLVQRLMEIDPLNAWTPAMRGCIEMFCDGRFDLAVESNRGGLALLDVPNARFSPGLCACRCRAAQRCSRRSRTCEPTSGRDLFVKGCIF